MARIGLGLKLSEQECVTAGLEPVAAPEGWVAFRKPVPAEIDEWPAYLHGPDNNAVAADEVVGPPTQLRWTGGPVWARHHDHMPSMVAMVSAAGRLFSIIDEGATASIQLPAAWRLVARDAFNGKTLWKQPIEAWWPRVWPNKLGPALLPRHLVAKGDRVYVTLGLNAPLSALDAGTGDVVKTFDGTQATEEVLLSEGVLFLVVADRVQAPSDPATMQMRKTPVARQRDPAPRAILAIRADTGEVQWAARTGIEFMDVRGREPRPRNDWTRGGCLYGIMPANGLIYTPPHACACLGATRRPAGIAESGLNGALAPADADC